MLRSGGLAISSKVGIRTASYVPVLSAPDLAAGRWARGSRGRWWRWNSGGAVERRLAFGGASEGFRDASSPFTGAFSHLNAYIVELDAPGLFSDGCVARSRTDSCVIVAACESSHNVCRSSGSRISDR